MKDVFDTEFKFSLFGKGKPVSSTRRHALESVFTDVAFPIMACNGKC